MLLLPHPVYVYMICKYTYALCWPKKVAILNGMFESFATFFAARIFYEIYMFYIGVPVVYTFSFQTLKFFVIDFDI